MNRMELKKLYTKFIGKCDCGYEKDINPLQELDKETFHNFIVPFECPNCGKVYVGLVKDEKAIKRKNKIMNIVLISIPVIILTIILSSAFLDNSKPTFYDTGNPNDMTKKEFDNFMKWQDENKNKELENEKIFD